MVERMTHDATDYPWTDDVRNDAEAARYWAAKHGEALSDIQDIRASVSLALAQRDMWWPCAFAVGVLCGIGLAVLW